MLKPVSEEPPEANILNEIEGLVVKYIWLPPEERLVVALWILHTYVHDKYTFTPRLALLSPVYGVGKTTLLVLIEQLAADPSSTIHTTAAAMFRRVGTGGATTLLMDEADNQNLLRDKTLRSALNANRRGAKFARVMGGKTIDYDAFTPVALAAVGKLPHSLTQRSIIINMERYPGASTLERLDERNPIFRNTIHAMQEKIGEWYGTCELDRNPKVPLRNRPADNWRVLIAIADSLGRGKEARKAAVNMSKGLPDEDVKVFLLEDIRTVFDTLKVDRISSAELLGHLNKGEWSVWEGLDGDKPPHELTPHELAKMLRDFKIYPKTVWALGSRGARGSSSSGYYRKEFEGPWAAYCTPAHPHTHTPRS
jgi:hypothetical protein